MKYFAYFVITTEANTNVYIDADIQTFIDQFTSIMMEGRPLEQTCNCRGLFRDANCKCI